VPQWQHRMLALALRQCAHRGLEPLQPVVVVGDPLDRVAGPVELACF